MKKMVLFIALSFFPMQAQASRAVPTPTPWEQENMEQYESGLTGIEAFEGKWSLYLKSRGLKNLSKGGVCQSIRVPLEWMGRRIKLTAFVKSIEVDAAGLYVKVEDDLRNLNVDFMKDRYIKGSTPWKQYKLVVDIPQNATLMEFGIKLQGKGKVFVDRFNFTTAGSEEEVTGKVVKGIHRQLQNLDFESSQSMQASTTAPIPTPWMQENTEQYESGLTGIEAFEGKRSLYLKSKNIRNLTRGSVGQYINIPFEWTGRRIKMTTFVKAIRVENAAGLYMIVYDDFGNFVRDFMEDRYIEGSTPWNQYKIILDIPQNAYGMDFGIMLVGKGEVITDKFDFTPVDSEEEVTGKFFKKLYGQPKNLNFEDVKSPQ